MRGGRAALSARVPAPYLDGLPANAAAEDVT